MRRTPFSSSFLQRLELEELEFRWQPAAHGIGLSVAALHVPDTLPATSALVRLGLVDSSAGDQRGSRSVTTDPAPTTGGNTDAGVEANANPVAVITTVQTQEILFSVGHFASSHVSLTAVSILTVSFIISPSTSQPTSTTDSNETTGFGTMAILTSVHHASVQATSVAAAVSASNALSTTTLPQVIASAFAAPGTITSPTFTTTTTGSLTSADQGQAVGPAATPQGLSFQSGQFSMLWSTIPADDGIGAQSKPEQPPADSKPEPATVQPAIPDVSATSPGQPTADVIPIAPSEPAVVADLAVVQAASGAPVAEEEGVSDRTWFAAAASVIVATAGYPLYLWYQKLRRARVPQLSPAGQPEGAFN